MKKFQSHGSMALLGAVAWLVLALPCAAQQKRYEVDYREAVEYGTGASEKLLLDLALPKNATEPTAGILFIHGGGWAHGNRSSHVAQVKDAAAQGFLAVTVGYRFAPKHLFPAQVEDCKCAVRYLRAHAKELNLDPARLGAIGYSAGAHLSMMLGTMDPPDGLEGDGGWADQSSKVQAVVSFVGPTNLDAEYPPVSKAIVENFLGEKRETKADVYRRASPITYVDKSDAPMLLLQGTTDVLVPYEQAFLMAKALTDAGVPGRVELLLGLGHGWGGAEAARTNQAAMLFFQQHLRKK